MSLNVYLVGPGIDYELVLGTEYARGRRRGRRRGGGIGFRMEPTSWHEGLLGRFAEELVADDPRVFARDEDGIEFTARGFYWRFLKGVRLRNVPAPLHVRGDDESEEDDD